MQSLKEQIKKTWSATPEELYTVGFEDGEAGLPDLGLMHLTDYASGYYQGLKSFPTSDYCAS